jgi:hypothetical protein
VNFSSEDMARAWKRGYESGYEDGFCHKDGIVFPEETNPYEASPL